MSPEEMSAERQTSHGDFRDNGRIMQALKDTMRQMGRNWGWLQPYQREALDMIQHKVGRILSGNPDWLDHWDDISGYALCTATILREDARPIEPPARPLAEAGSFIASQRPDLLF